MPLKEKTNVTNNNFKKKQFFLVFFFFNHVIKKTWKRILKYEKKGVDGYKP